MAWNVETIVSLAAYVGGGLAMGLGAIGAAIGEGNTAAQANVAVSRNPKISGDIFKNMLVGQAVAESASIFALVIAILLLFFGCSDSNPAEGRCAIGGRFKYGPGCHRLRRRFRKAGRRSLLWNCQATRSNLPVNDQHADRLGCLPDPGHLLYGGCFNADIY